MLRSLFLLLALAISGHTVESKAAAPIILVFGDSLSAGYGLAAAQAWPALLQQRLRAEGWGHGVVNASVSGETTGGGLSRLPQALRTHAPAIVILELGANDGLRGLPLASMRQNLVAMVGVCRKAGARVLLVGMRLPPNYGPAYAGGFGQTFADVAKKEKAEFLPFLLDGFAERPEMFQADGLHPVAEAQPIILDTVWRGLVPMLRK